MAEGSIESIDGLVKQAVRGMHGIDAVVRIDTGGRPCYVFYVDQGVRQFASQAIGEWTREYQKAYPETLFGFRIENARDYANDRKNMPLNAVMLHECQVTQQETGVLERHVYRPLRKQQDSYNSILARLDDLWREFFVTQAGITGAVRVMKDDVPYYVVFVKEESQISRLVAESERIRQHNPAMPSFQLQTPSGSSYDETKVRFNQKLRDETIDEFVILYERGMTQSIRRTEFSGEEKLL